MPYLLFTAGHVAIIMILMQHRRDHRRIHHRQILLPHRFDQPMVKPQPPDREIGNLRIHSFWEHEHINGCVVFVLAGSAGAPLDGLFPARVET